MKTIKTHRMFDGEVRYIRHDSTACSVPMEFTVFLPKEALAGENLPVLYFLSGLTCTAENFTVKAAAQRHAAEEKLIIVAPDTSPRGENVADDERYCVGKGASFYVNATEAPFAANYQMFDYVTEELPALIDREFPVIEGARGVTGHSMGGHGALIAALKKPGFYRSLSAFAPIASPSRVPWGQAALPLYLGEDEEAHRGYDATFLMAEAKERLPILVDQGTADNFLKEQLRPELLEEAAKTAGHPLEIRMREGYDHSYFFVQTFIEDHIRHHAKALHN
ncbi:MAG: S-formylglutathione hydrolase [Sandaracinaceae bacterium]|nr:S-formylglutathione hydrolase [Sandaracinaceae bacterium]